MSGPLRLACAAPLAWESGYEHLLVAVDLVRRRSGPISLEIAGSGWDLERVLFAVVDLELDDVVRVNGPERAVGAIASCDLCVSSALAGPVVWLRGEGVATADVVATHVAGPELQDHPQVDLVAPYDPGALAVAIERNRTRRAQRP